MANLNRTAILTKTYNVLRKHYKPVILNTDRTVLEHLLFACCLENSPFSSAEKVCVDLAEQFFDWNEVRVSSVRELSEVMQPLNDPEHAARRVKGVLQSVFESVYAFDLEALKKLNIGEALKMLEKYEGTTPFTISYFTQVALGGHSIPVNEGGFKALVVVGALTEAEADKGRVPGLERSIPKSKGIESGSLFHQWGVEFRANPYSPPVRKLLLEIAPDCRDRLPKRPTKRTSAKEAKDTLKLKPDSVAPSKGVKKKEAAEKRKAAPPKKKTEKMTNPKKKPAVKKKGGGSAKKIVDKKKVNVKRLSKRKPR